jgi:iron complex outermembrane receptor protein
MVSQRFVCAPVPARVTAPSWLVRVAVSTALAGGAATPAFAQEQAPDVQEVTVTGSRILRRDLTAASPIVTVQSEALETSSTTAIESVLQQMPQFVPGSNQFVSGAQAGAAQTPGAATLNLRGLGANRNLVLLDGRRAQPANALLVVDVNTIPALAIQGVEVITGGASAVYGPDAIAGVVNFVLKKDFQGIEFDAQTGMSDQSDGEETRISALMGTNAAEGRANIMVGLDWTKREGVFQRDRDFYVNGWRDPNNPGADFIQTASYAGGQVLAGGPNAPTPAAINSIFPGIVPPDVAPGPGSEFRFDNSGNVFVTAQGRGYTGPLGALDAGRYTMVTKLFNGNIDQKYTTQFVSTPLERHSLFLRGRYDITDNISGFVQGNYSNIQVDTRGNLAPAVTVWQAPIPRDGRALPAALNTLLDSRPRPNDPWSLYQVLDYFGPLSAENTTNVWQLMAGLQGKMGVKDWTWEAYVSKGDTNTISEVPLPSLQRYSALVAAPNFGQGAKLTGTGRGFTLTCTTGLPVFQEFTPSQDCLTGIETRTRQLTTLSQDIVEANMQGAAFNLPAGEVRFAAGATYRKNDFRFDPGYPVEQFLDNPIGLFASNSTAGSTNVKEIYGELLVPVVQKLDLELGYRLSDFNTAGTVDTYKGMFTWKALDSVTFRGGYQFATRAPNTAELFTGPSLAVVSFPAVDPCSAVTLSPWGNVKGNPNRLQVQQLCRELIGNSTSAFDTQTYGTEPGPNGFTRQTPPFFPLEIEVTQGNPKVQAEEGRTWTLGAVLTEPFGWQRMTFTVDAYRIRVTDTIAPISSTTVYNNCFNFNGTSNPTYDVNNPFCALIDRNPVTGDREQVFALYSNLGTLETQGVDLSFSWNRDVGPGNLALQATGSYLDYFRFQPDPGSPLNDTTGTIGVVLNPSPGQDTQFDYRLLTNVAYRWAGFNVGMAWRFLPSIDNQAQVTSPTSTTQGTPSYSVFNLFGSYSFAKTQLRVGIDNVLDKQPPVVGANPGNASGVGFDSNADITNPSFYDALGRRYYVGVKMSF